MPEDGDFSISSGCGDKRPGRILFRLMLLAAWLSDPRGRKRS